MFNYLKFLHILICVCIPHNQSLIFICLWLNQNVTKPPLFLTVIINIFIIDSDPIYALVYNIVWHFHHKIWGVF